LGFLSGFLADVPAMADACGACQCKTTGEGSSHTLGGKAGGLLGYVRLTA
jgi:hypothetical protein